MNEETIRKELSDGEQLVWWGVPTKKIMTKSERLRLPFSTLLIVVFAVYWFMNNEGIEPVMIAIVTAALAFVFYSTVVKLTVKNDRRKRTLYALTGSRLIFMLMDKKTGLRRRTADIDIAKLNGWAVDLNKDGTGTILFSEQKEVSMLPLKVGGNWTANPIAPLMAFFDITEPEEVLRMFKEVRKKNAVETETGDSKTFNKYDE